MPSRSRAYVRQHHWGMIATFLVLSGGTAYALDGENTVDSGDIINDQVKSADVRDDTRSNGGLLSQDIAADALTGADIATNAIRSSEVADNGLTGVDIAPQSLSGSNVEDQSLTGIDIQDDSIGTFDVFGLQGADIANGTILGADVADNTLGSEDVRQEGLRGEDIDEGTLSGFNRAQLGPRAYAYVLPGGGPLPAGVDEANSLGVTDAMVTRLGGGINQTDPVIYCFDLGFDVKHVQVTPTEQEFAWARPTGGEDCDPKHDAVVETGTFFPFDFMVSFD